MITGFLNVAKSSGMTSHDVVAQLRRWLKRHGSQAKVGHAGTLDPMATGVLIICLGHATRLSEYVMHATKRYHAVVRLGSVTDTYDAEGEILQTWDSAHITQDQIESALRAFRGEIQQVPPMYSAIKQGGRKLYELARAGQEVERQARSVTLYEINLISYTPPDLTLDVVCSAGTYIRSLAYDLGAALGIGAHLAALTRTASGTFSLENAVTLETLVSAASWQSYLIAPQHALPEWSRVSLTPEEAAELQDGGMIARTDTTSTSPALGLLEASLIALLEARDGYWQPLKVFRDRS